MFEEMNNYTLERFNTHIASWACSNVRSGFYFVCKPALASHGNKFYFARIYRARNFASETVKLPTFVWILLYCCLFF